MLSVNPFDTHAAARMLDFFGARTPWQRSLWSPGTVLSLKETLEGSQAVQEGILNEGSFRNLVESTIALIGPDPGVGATARKQTLVRALKSPIRMDGAEYNQIKLLLQAVEAEYLQNWATALRANTPPRAERSARYIASFLLDAGFSAPYLHRWMTYRVEHEAGTRRLADILDDAIALVSAPPKAYRVLVVFEAAAEAKSGPPANWVEAAVVAEWLQANNHQVTGVRQNGGMWFSVEAPDSWSAVGKVVEIVDRLTSRVVLGTSGRLIPFPSAWVEGQPKRYRFGILPRQVQVHALHREDKLYTVTKGNYRRCSSRASCTIGKRLSEPCHHGSVGCNGSPPKRPRRSRCDCSRSHGKLGCLLICPCGTHCPFVRAREDRRDACSQVGSLRNQS